MWRVWLAIVSVSAVGLSLAATIETRDHIRLEGTLVFEDGSLVVTDTAGKKTKLSLKDTAHITFSDPPRTSTLTNADWTSVDVGEVYAPGTTALTNGEVALTASGWGLWRDADGLRFASIPFSGDGEIIARVRGFDDAHGTVLAGISIRESERPRARHISLLQSSKGMLAFRARDEDGFTRQTLPLERSNAWLRLTRSGTRFAAYISDDAKSWVPVEGTSFSASNILRAGFFVSTEVNAVLGTAKFAEVVVREGSVSRERTDLPVPAIVLRDGTVLAGQISATNEIVQFVREGVTNHFNIHGLAALLFRPVAAEVVLQPAISPKTGVVMNDRDWLEGEVREFTPQGVVLGTLFFGAKTVRWSDQPAAIVLGGRTDSANWEIILKDGSQIRAKDFSIRDQSGTARTAAALEMPFILTQLLEIRAVNAGSMVRP